MPRENQSELRRKIYPIIVGKNFAVEVSYMEKMKYKMSSRATILLGRESVSRVDGAIIELVGTVKNYAQNCLQAPAE